MRKASVGALTLSVLIVAASAWGIAAPRTRPGGTRSASAVVAAPMRARAPAPVTSWMAATATATETATPSPAPQVIAAPKAPEKTPTPVTRPEDVECGSVIAKSMKLEFSLTNCAGDGVVIGANGIRLDLDGYTIDGADGPHTAGVRNTRGFTGVTITGGLIQEFESGVAIGGNRDIKNNVVDLELTDNRTGITLTKTKGNNVRKNELTANEVGIEIAADSNTIDDNDISESRPGIKLNGNSNTISDNIIDGGGDGIEGTGDKNTINDNDLRRGAGAGIILTGASNVLDSNDVREFGSVGIWLQQDDGSTARSNVIRDNDIGLNGHDGILVDADTTTLDSNGASRNAGDGIAVRGHNPLVKDNDAHSNGGYGIHAPTEARGSGNMAGGNDGTDCSPAVLCD